MTGEKNKNIKTAFLLKNNLIWQNKQSSLIYNVQLNIYRRLSECPVPLNCSARRFDFRALTAAVESESADASQSFGTWFEIEKQRIFFWENDNWNRKWKFRGDKLADKHRRRIRHGDDHSSADNSDDLADQKKRRKSEKTERNHEQAILRNYYFKKSNYFD